MNNIAQLSFGSLATLVVSLVSLLVAVASAAYTMGSVVERIRDLEEAVPEPPAPVVFGDWELSQHSQPYTAETDGFVVVRSQGDTNPAESDFEIFVEGDDGFRARTRGGQYQGAATPVPKGRRWEVQRGSSSNSGTMDVHWIPLLERE